MVRRGLKASLVAAALLAAGAAGAAEPPAARLAALPITATPAPGAGDTLVVFYSGDGGWAAADRGMTEAFLRAGMPVVGIDSLRYFMVRRSPEAAAADLAMVLRHYMAQWNRSRIVLAGYSFGAGAAPLIEPKLPADLRARIRLVALVDPEKQAELKFQPGDWLNLAGPGATPIGPALAQLKGLPLVCIYGSGEPGAACAGLPPALGRSVQVPGGHHYGGDYDRVGRAMLTALPR